MKGEEVKKLVYMRTIEENNTPIDGHPYHRVQKLYKQEGGSFVVASGLKFKILNEVALFQTNWGGEIDGKHEMGTVYGTHNIEEALKAMGYVVEGQAVSNT